MADSFTPDAENKIVITDGECFFLENHQGILWIVINYDLPCCFDSTSKSNINPATVNAIFINEKDIPMPENKKRYIKKQKR